jgi:Flp pilus assembly protein TadG
MTPFRFAHRARKSGKIAHSDGAARHRVGARLRGLLRDTSGITGLEFAMIGPIFLLMVMAVLENGFTLWTQSVLDNATRDASRLLQTGQSQSGGTSFATQLCNEISGFMSCSQLQYRVQNGSTFAAISPSISFGTGGAATGFSAYPTAVSTSSLTAGTDVVVQVIYKRNFIIPWVGKIMTGTSDYEELLATATFQIEPY